MDTFTTTTTTTRPTREQLDRAACLSVRLAVRHADRGDWRQAAARWEAAADDWSAAGYLDAAIASYMKAAECWEEVGRARPTPRPNVAALLD